MGVTIALFRVASLLYSVDLPTLGLPTITTRKAPPRAGALSGDLDSRLSAAGGLVVPASRGRRRPAGAFGRVLSARKSVVVVDGGGVTVVGVAVIAGFRRGVARIGAGSRGERGGWSGGEEGQDCFRFLNSSTFPRLGRWETCKYTIMQKLLTEAGVLEI